MAIQSSAFLHNKGHYQMARSELKLGWCALPFQWPNAFIISEKKIESEGQMELYSAQMFPFALKDCQLGLLLFTITNTTLKILLFKYLIPVN